MKINKILGILLATATLVACNSGAGNSSQSQQLDATHTALTASSANDNPTKATSQAVFNSLHPLNIAYEENPSITQLNQVGKYTFSATGKPFFNVVILFAANINGSLESPTLFYNPQFKTLLQTSDGLAAIQNLQKKGILVLMTYMGNNESAGWSCFKNKNVETTLAKQMVSDINKYGLDGIDIDDEWSTCGAQRPASIYNMAQAIKGDPLFKGKILTKALFADNVSFLESNNMAKFLDGGWQMSYGDQESYTVYDVLSHYQNAGMNKTGLAIGVDPDIGDPQIYTDTDHVTAMTQGAILNGFGGVMIFDVNGAFPNGANGASYMSNISQVEFNDNVSYTGPTPPSGAPSGDYMSNAQSINWDGSHLSAVYDGVTTPVLDYAAVCESGATVSHVGSVLSCSNDNYAAGLLSIVSTEPYYKYSYWPASCSIEEATIDNSLSGCADKTTSSANSSACIEKIQVYCTNSSGVYVASEVSPNSGACYDSANQYWNIALNSSTGQLSCPTSATH